MKKLIFSGLISALFVIAGHAQPPTAAPAPAPRPTPPPYTSLKVGDDAPDFTLGATDGTKVHLADFRGKSNVVLAFYILAFTGG
jgi:cytochrome oxidase Cu insertion factor (SCO1/SenC/PrrC family)